MDNMRPPSSVKTNELRGHSDIHEPCAQIPFTLHAIGSEHFGYHPSDIIPYLPSTPPRDCVQPSLRVYGPIALQGTLLSTLRPVSTSRPFLICGYYSVRLLYYGRVSHLQESFQVCLETKIRQMDSDIPPPKRRLRLNRSRCLKQRHQGTTDPCLEESSSFCLPSRQTSDDDLILAHNPIGAGKIR